MSYREKCLEEKEERCVICGSTDSIQVHHVDGDRANNSIENLEPLCNSCHSSVHAGAEGFEEWTEKLLPSHERKRTVTLTLTPELSRQLEVVRETSPADSDSEALRFAIRERADTVDGLRSVLAHIDDLRESPTESDAAVIDRALRFRDEAPDRYEDLLETLARNVSPRVLAEVAETLSTEDVPIAVSSRFEDGTVDVDVQVGDDE